MKPKKWTYGSIGSVSHATMRPEDLIPAFCSELRYLGHRSKELSKIERDSEKEGYYESEQADFDLESLFNMLDEHALPWVYFGSHPGDGSDYGFWVSENIIHDFDGLRINEDGKVYSGYSSHLQYVGNEIPTSYTGDVLHVNERGNMTLYACKRGKLREVWAVV